MGILSTNDIFQQWKYTTSEIIILFQGESKTLPNERLSSISIINDYEGNIYPIFRIELVLESSLYYKILQNKDSVKFKLRIQKYYTKFGDDKKSLMKDYINDTFDLILDDNDDDMNDAVKKEAMNNDYRNITEKDDNDIVKTDNKIEFFLFKSDILNNAKTIVGGPLQNVTITDAFDYLASKMKLRNWLVSPFDNTQVYSELPIPTMGCLDAIKFLDTYYGFYKTGSMLYMGLDYSYLLKYDPKCTAYINDDSRDVNIVIPDYNAKYVNSPCTAIKRDTPKIDYIVGDNTNISSKNASITNDIIGSNDITTIDSDTGDIVASSSGAVTKGSNNTRIISDATENKWIGDIYTTQTKMQSNVLPIVLGDYDASVLQPNKRYSLIFDDASMTKKYKGDWLLTSASHTFTKTGADFTISSTIVLKKK